MKFKEYLQENTEYTLNDLKGGISFNPKFNGIPFIVNKKGVYKSTDVNKYRMIRMRDISLELRWKEQKDLMKLADYYGGDYLKFAKDLEKSKKFHFHVIK